MSGSWPWNAVNKFVSRLANSVLSYKLSKRKESSAMSSNGRNPRVLPKPDSLNRAKPNGAGPRVKYLWPVGLLCEYEYEIFFQSAPSHWPTRLFVVHIVTLTTSAFFGWSLRELPERRWRRNQCNFCTLKLTACIHLRCQMSNSSGLPFNRLPRNVLDNLINL